MGFNPKSNKVDIGKCLRPVSNMSVSQMAVIKDKLLIVRPRANRKMAKRIDMQLMVIDELINQ